MSTSRAKTVPPGPAMGPSMVRAARKTERVVRDRVSREARAPRGGNREPHSLVKTSWKGAKGGQHLFRFILLVHRHTSRDILPEGAGEGDGSGGTLGSCDTQEASLTVSL